MGIVIAFQVGVIGIRVYVGVAKGAEVGRAVHASSFFPSPL